MSCLEFLTHNLYDDVSSLLAKYYKHFQVPSGALGGGIENSWMQKSVTFMKNSIIFQARKICLHSKKSAYK